MRDFSLWGHEGAITMSLGLAVIRVMANKSWRIFTWVGPLVTKVAHVVTRQGVFSRLRRAFRKKSPRMSLLKMYIKGKHGLEIGGPSGIFADNALLPIYDITGSLDNCNFSSETVWEGVIREELGFKCHPNKPLGRQFICEASNMERINNEQYDFVMSSHVIEHVANPLKALLEWKRVLRIGGIMLLVSPHKQGTFDHRRPVTPLTHLIEDSNKDVDEHDLTHLGEILELHDLSQDPGAGSREQFLARSRLNFENRCLHHHVFVTETWIRILDYLNLDILWVEVVLPFHIIIAGNKVVENDEELRTLHESNARLLLVNAKWRGKSPFHADKAAQS
jgi:SAM-dependent methyltransferase